MTVVTNGDTRLREQLAAAQKHVSELNDKRAVKARGAATAKQRYTSGDTSDTNSPTFREAAHAAAELHAVQGELEQARDAETGLLKMLGAKQTSPNLGSIDARAPGGWLAREIVHHKNPAMALGLTTTDIGSTDSTDRVFFDRLRERSAILDSGVPTFDIDASEVRIPLLTGRLDPAVETAELDPIDEQDPPIDHVTISPPKFGKLVTFSLEAYRDARPLVLAATERELVGSIAEGFDAAAFTDILATSGTVAVDATAGVTDLDFYVEAISSLRAARATATAIYMHPSAYQELAQLKKLTGSNEPLVSAALSATGAPAESILGIPVYQSTSIPALKVIVAAVSELLVVRRSNIELAIDEMFQFASAGVGLRAIARLKLVVAQPSAVAVITLS